MSSAAPTRPDLTRFARIPLALTELPRWVLWKYVDHDGKPTKEPFQTSGAHADSTNPATWADYTTTLQAYADHPDRYDGIGFALGDGFIGMDLDNALDDAGALKAWAQPFADAVRTYAEISPSGKGIKFIGRGALPTGKTGIRRSRPGGEAKEAVELYQRGRYFTLTGNHWTGHPRTAEECTECFVSVFREVDAWNKPKATSAKAPAAVAPDDQKIIDKVRADPKYARLWSGDFTGYGSQSEADLALCGRIAFFTGPDAADIARIFTKSGLNRDKWAERPDYWERTIAKSLEGKTEFYKWNGNASSKVRKPDSVAEVASPSADDDAIPLTEYGNAQLLVNAEGRDYRYHAARGLWLRYHHGRWADDADGGIVRAAKRIARSFWREAEKAESRTPVLRHAQQSEKATAIDAMLKLARSELGMTVTADQLDADPFLFNTLTGTINLKNGELREHDRADLLTKLAPVRYDPAARCPLWTAILNRIMAGNESLIRYLQRLAGLCLTGAASEQELYIFHGSGANGKSVFLDTVAGIMGDYACEAAPSLLTTRSQDQHPTELADLAGRRLVVASETEEGARLRVQLVKRLTGNKRIKGRFMRRDFFEFDRTHKLVLVTNNRPVIRETTNAAWRRIRLVPFNVTIPPDEQDRDLLDKLRSEWPGILRWAVEGCSAWLHGGMQTPREVLVATEAYQAEQDPLVEFLAAKCIVVDGLKASRAELLSAYQTWCKATNEPSPMDRNTLYEHVRRIPGVDETMLRIGGKPTHVFTGVGLADLANEYRHAQGV